MATEELKAIESQGLTELTACADVAAVQAMLAEVFGQPDHRTTDALVRDIFANADRMKPHAGPITLPLGDEAEQFGLPPLTILSRSHGLPDQPRRPSRGVACSAGAAKGARALTSVRNSRRWSDVKLAARPDGRRAP